MVEGNESLGPYRIVRRLGVGGMAETFEAVRVDPSGFEQRVCLKRVLPAFRGDRAFVERFEKEALLAAGLRHSNVVGVLDFGSEDGVPYMALELVDGPDLRAVLSKREARRLPLGQALLVASDVAMALAYAHAPGRGAPGVVHRDVSPSNVLLGRAGDVKLADFGIAKAIDGAGATASGEVRGKIPYMSPEHMRGQPVDGRSDLFSLGVMLFEMIAGVRPFDGAHDVETMTHVLANERQELAALVPDVPDAVAAIVDRLLEGQPEARFPGAAEVLVALEAAGVDARERRALAAEVEATLGGPLTRHHVVAGPSARAPRPATELTPLSPAAEPTETVGPPARRKPRGRRALPIALAIAVFAAGGAVALRSVLDGPARGRAITPSAHATSRPHAEAPPRRVSPVSAGASPEALAPRRTVAAAPALVSVEGPGLGSLGQEAAPPTEASERAGRLRVTVIPWGRVWVDGRPLGRAPRAVALPEGEHLVQAGYDRPSAGRRVQIAEGRSAHVQFDLD